MLWQGLTLIKQIRPTMITEFSVDSEDVPATAMNSVGR
jgi:hypothetical protein